MSDATVGQLKCTKLILWSSAISKCWRGKNHKLILCLLKSQKSLAKTYENGNCRQCKHMLVDIVVDSTLYRARFELCYTNVQNLRKFYGLLLFDIQVHSAILTWTTVFSRLDILLDFILQWRKLSNEGFYQMSFRKLFLTENKGHEMFKTILRSSKRQVLINYINIANQPLQKMFLNDWTKVLRRLDIFN